MCNIFISKFWKFVLICRLLVCRIFLSFSLSLIKLNVYQFMSYKYSILLFQAEEGYWCSFSGSLEFHQWVSFLNQTQYRENLIKTQASSSNKYLMYKWPDRLKEHFTFLKQLIWTIWSLMFVMCTHRMPFYCAAQLRNVFFDTELPKAEAHVSFMNVATWIWNFLQTL